MYNNVHYSFIYTLIISELIGQEVNTAQLKTFKYHNTIIVFNDFTSAFYSHLYYLIIQTFGIY